MGSAEQVVASNAHAEPSGICQNRGLVFEPEEGLPVTVNTVDSLVFHYADIGLRGPTRLPRS